MTTNIPGFDGPQFDEYIGDGIYAAFDGCCVLLRVGSHEADPVVHIDTGEWHRLMRWHARVMDIVVPLPDGAKR